MRALLPMLCLLAALPLLAACSDTGPEETKSYGQGTFVQGGTCFTRNRKGQLVRVSPTNCPSLRANQAEETGEAASTGAETTPTE
ncbi:MAG: hypothetical protein AAFP17_02135 [Pseudomonadota bacterium]